MKFSIKFRKYEDLPIIDVYKTNLAAKMLPTIIEFYIGKDKIEEEIPLILFYSEFMRSMTQCILYGREANIYANSTPFAWVSRCGRNFIIKYNKGSGEKISELIRYENMIDVIGHVNCNVKEILEKKLSSIAIKDISSSRASFDFGIVNCLFSES